MRHLFYRVRVTFWLWELSGCGVRKAWMHSQDAMTGYDMAFEKPKDCATNYIKYWGVE